MATIHSYNQLGTVARKPLWWFMASTLAVLMFIVSGILQNLPQIKVYFILDNPVGPKILALLRFAFSTGTTYTTLGLVLIIILSILFGINIALFITYVRSHRTNGAKFKSGNSIKSLAGILAGIFGVGCAACGAALIGPVFSTLGIAGAISFLPLHGQEISIIGILLLIASIWSLIKYMKKPPVCEIE